MMQSMGLQRIGEDLATEEEQQQLQNYYCQVAKKKKKKSHFIPVNQGKQC